MILARILQNLRLRPAGRFLDAPGSSRRKLPDGRSTEELLSNVAHSLRAQLN